MKASIQYGISLSSLKHWLERPAEERGPKRASQTPQTKCSPKSHYPLLQHSTPSELDTKKGLHTGDFFCSPLTSVSRRSTFPKAPSSQAEEFKPSPPLIQDPSRKGSSRDRHWSRFNLLQRRWPGSISHPRSQLGASAPAHMCCADGRRARAAAASPVRAPCTLAVQPICMFTAAICPGLLNVCSQKHGQMKKKKWR